MAANNLSFSEKVDNTEVNYVPVIILLSFVMYFGTTRQEAEPYLMYANLLCILGFPVAII
jgi:hypothetical protein